MIRKVTEKDLGECTDVIKESFFTVAQNFGFTPQNTPRFTAFATTKEVLHLQLAEEHRQMYAFYSGKSIVGYYSLLLAGFKKGGTILCRIVVGKS